MNNELQRLAARMVQLVDDQTHPQEYTEVRKVCDILTTLAQATKDEPETAIVNDGYDDLVTKENRDYWKCKAERYMVLTESQVRINALLNEENDQLKQQLAIYKGRDEGKQLVINQLEAENERLRKAEALLDQMFEDGGASWPPGAMRMMYDELKRQGSPGSAPAEPTCEWKRVGDYMYKASCKGCTFQIRSDLEDMGNCPDCKAKIKVSR